MKQSGVLRPDFNINFYFPKPIKLRKEEYKYIIELAGESDDGRLFN
jgi:hypothetical protein